MPLSAPRTWARRHALGGEQRHLRVVGDRSRRPSALLQAGHATRTEPAPDLLEAHEFDRSAQSVPHRAAQETTTETGDVCESTHADQNYNLV